MESSADLFQKVAQKYGLCLADFPSALKPEHLNIPPGDQAALFAGLSTLHTVIGQIYNHFALAAPTEACSTDRETCTHRIEAPVRLLWALGITGQLIQTPDGLELHASRVDLDPALKHCSCKDPAGGFEILESVGFKSDFRDQDGLPCPGGFKKCTSVAVRYPAANETLLRALVYYAARLPKKQHTQKSVIFEVFLRADFRPLLPGYTFHMPHLPADEQEAARTFDPQIRAVWDALTAYMARRHPQFRLYFRVPSPGGDRWVADYSKKDNDYGWWSIFVDKEGISVRIVFSEKSAPDLRKHIPDLSPGFQETYLNSVLCKDCVRCGRHVFYQHGDHVHRLCKAPWFHAAIQLEDLPDIERLVDLRLSAA